MAHEACATHHVHQEEVDTARAAMLDERETDRLAELFRVFGDMTRVRIIRALSVSELCVCDLSELLGMSASAVSHQLRVLRGARLVRNRRQGKMVFYSLDDEHVARLFDIGLEHVREAG